MSFTGHLFASSYSRSKPYLGWIWRELLKPVYLRLLDFASTRFGQVTLVILIAPEVIPVTHSFADWSNLIYDWIESITNSNNAVVEAIGR